MLTSVSTDHGLIACSTFTEMLPLLTTSSNTCHSSPELVEKILSTKTPLGGANTFLADGLNPSTRCSFGVVMRRYIKDRSTSRYVSYPLELRDFDFTQHLINVIIAYIQHKSLTCVRLNMLGCALEGKITFLSRLPRIVDQLSNIRCNSDTFG